MDLNNLLVTSNGKSSILEERLYSFFFAFFKKKNEASFFRFSSSTQLLMKTFVLLRSCKIVKNFTSFCFVFTNFWNTPIRFTIDFEKVGLIPLASLCSKILEQPGHFASIFRSLGTSSSFRFRSYNISRTKLRSCFDLDKLKANNVRFASLQRP
jgi:hypothetical protein